MKLYQIVYRGSSMDSDRPLPQPTRSVRYARCTNWGDELMIVRDGEWCDVTAEHQQLREDRDRYFESLTDWKHRRDRALATAHRYGDVTIPAGTLHAVIVRAGEMQPRVERCDSASEARLLADRLVAEGTFVHAQIVNVERDQIGTEPKRPAILDSDLAKAVYA